MSLLRRVLSPVVQMLALVLCPLSAAYAAGIEPQEPEAFADKLVDLVQSLGVPVGGAILLLSVVILTVRVMLAQGRPEKMAETMQGFGWLCVAGAILGAAVFIAGVILGIGQRLGS